MKDRLFLQLPDNRWCCFFSLDIGQVSLWAAQSHSSSHHFEMQILSPPVLYFHCLWVLISLASFLYLTHMREMILLVSLWLTSLSTTHSRALYIATHFTIFSLLWSSRITLHICTSLSIESVILEHFGFFPNVDIVNSAVTFSAQRKSGSKPLHVRL